jgi:hypothetical protein
MRMNRRDFIKTTAILSAGLAIAPARVLAEPKRALWYIGISLPEEMREAHELMLSHGYYWFNLFGMEPADDDPYTQSEYLHTFLDTTTKISVRMYHTGEHWMLQNPDGKWKVAHRSWVNDILSKMIYAQKRGLTYENTTYNGRKYTHIFKVKDGSGSEEITHE